MTGHAHRQTFPRDNVRFVRSACVLLALLVCALLVPAATAGAKIPKQHRGAYKSKLNYYRDQMDKEVAFYTTWKAATESHTNIIRMALADPELQKSVPQLESAALDERSLLQNATSKSRDKIYANIAAFRAAALQWFTTKADKKAFKTRLAVLRGGFVGMFSADEDLMQALSLLGTNADVAGATNEVMSAGMGVVAAETQFDTGLELLRGLQ